MLLICGLVYMFGVFSGLSIAALCVMAGRNNEE